MTDQEFIAKWKGFCAANGVTAQAEIEVADGLMVEGYIPPTYLVWRTATGTLYQGVSILQMTDQPGEFVKHVQYAYGLPQVLKVSWNDYLNPPAAPTEEKGDPMVGDLFEAARRLYYVKGNAQEGSRYEPSNGPLAGRKFVAVRIASPFTLHWQEK